MSVINDSKLLSKSINISNCELPKISYTNNNNMDNYFNKAENTTTKRLKLSNQFVPKVNNYLYVSSNIGEVYLDSEKSNKLIISKDKSILHNSSLSTSCFSDKDSSFIRLKPPLASSTPDSNVKNNHHSETNFKSFIKTSLSKSVRQIKNSSNKSQKNILQKRNKKQTKQIDTLLNISKPLPQINPNTVNKTISSKQSPIAFQNLSLTGTNKENEDDITVYKSLSDTQSNANENNNINITEQLNLLEKVNPLKSKNSLNTSKEENKNTYYPSNINISNNSNESFYINTIKNYKISKQDYFNKTDSSELLKMEITLKMFSGSIVPYLNELKHDILQLINNVKYKPNKYKKSKNINDIVKNIYNMIFNMNECTDNSFYKKDHSSIPFVGIDINILNVLNGKVDNINVILKQNKITFINKVTKEEKKDEKTAEKYFDFQQFNMLTDLKSSISNHKVFREENKDEKTTNKFNDLEQYNNFNGSLDGLKSPVSIAESVSNVGSDSLDHMRNVNKLISLLMPIDNDLNFHESSQDLPLKNYSLKNVYEVLNKKDLNILTPNNNSLYNKVSGEENKDKNTTNKFNDLQQSNYFNSSLDGLKSPVLAKIFNNVGFDSLDNYRNINKSISLLLPIDNDINNWHESSQDLPLKNVSETSNKKDLTILTPYNNLLYNEVSGEENKNKNTTNKFNDLQQCNNYFNSSLNSLKSPVSIAENVNNVRFDSLDNIRNNKSISSLLPIDNDINCHESSQDLPIKKVCKVLSKKDLTSDNNSLYNELSINASTNSNKYHSINPSNENHVNYPENNLVGKNRYWLRNRPKPTDHYFSPFTSKTITNKPCSIKNSYNDVFVCKGRGQNKVILQYKIHSVIKNTTNDLLKTICPDRCNKNEQNTSIVDVKNLRPRKNEKPCPCGIFPSQVPSSWTDELHTLLHKNLHKIRFKIPTSINVINKINNNSFFYNIIKITQDSINDKKLKLMVKNVQDFINLELNYSKTNYHDNNNLYHSIFLAVIPNLSIIGFLEVEMLNNACIYQNNNQLSKTLMSVKFGVSKLWVMVKYRNNGVAKKLLEQFCTEECLKTNDIAFAYHGNNGISFIKKYFANNFVLIY